MQIEQQADQLRVWAPAKVNLFLEVLGKRNDGYHDIATAMITVRLFDTLTFKEEASGKIILQCSDPTLSTGTDNLIVRAARLLQQQANCARGVSIHLAKRIPMAAGLGGGSSDAAATLTALNQLWGLGLETRELADLGGQLGSDVPFFFFPPAAWCTGRGEKVVPLKSGSTLWFVLVSCPVGLSTATVYKALQVPAHPVSGEEIQAALAKGDIAEIGRFLHNRLQPAAESLCKELAKQKTCLAKHHPAGHLMSGSGTSMFALCRDQSEAMTIARNLRQDSDLVPGSQVFVLKSGS